MILGKRQDTGIRKREHGVALSGEVALEEAMKL
jgi:hypothetical protein